MKYKSCCPRCGKPQSRWDFSQPCPALPINAKFVRTDYKSNRISSFIGVCIGLIVAGSLISADKGFITWETGLIVTLILLVATTYASPYFIGLIELKESDRNMMKKWMLPFLRWQIFIIVFVILLISINAFTLVINEKFSNSICCTQDKVEKVESIEKLKLVIQSESNLFMSFSKMYKALLKFNVSISFFVFLYLVFNLLFYYKIRDIYNAGIKKEIGSQPVS